MSCLSLKTKQKTYAFEGTWRKPDVIDKAIVEVMEKAVVKEVELLRPIRKFDFD